MLIEEAKDILLNIIADEVIGTYCIEIQKEVDCSKNCEDEDCYLNQAIDTVINELEKKDKVIDEMATILTRYMSIFDNKPYDLSLGVGTRKMTVEEVKEYFYKKVSDI